MTTDEKPASHLNWLGSNLTLGLMVIIMSILTAVANYATYVVGGNSSDLQTAGDRLLADSNTDYITTSQYIIVDYNMYDGYYINQGKDDFAAEYYKGEFSPALQASVDRKNPFDDQYYKEMYAPAEDKYNQAFNKFDQANAAGERESGFQLAMLVAAVGLAFTAYASLLDESNRLRSTFSLMALLMMVLCVGLFVLALTK